MGSHLKDILIETGYEVFVTSRKQRKDGEHLHYLNGNAHDLVFLQLVLQQEWDAIVDFMIYSTEEFKQRVDLLTYATNQYFFISSSRVYANCDVPIKENSLRLLDCSSDNVFLATDEYSLKKAREENILINSSRKNYTIIRPYITYSENRLQLEDLECQQWLPRALDRRTIVLSEDIADKYTTLTYGRDVAKGIASLIGNKNAIGEVFHITCGEPIKWKEVLAIYLDTLEQHTGIRPKVKWIEKSQKLNRKESQYQIIYDRLYNRIFDNSKILSYAPFLSFVSPKEGLRKCLETSLEMGVNNFTIGTEAVMDRITGERMSISSLKTPVQIIKYLLYRYLYIDKLK